VKIFSVNKLSNISYNANQNLLYKDFLPVKTELPMDLYISNNCNPLDLALKYLSDLEFLPDDVEKVKKLGIRQIFKSGKEAVRFAHENNIPIIFDKVDAEDIHAQWLNNRHVIVINDRYKNTKNPAEVYAISAALIHELAHAKDNDSISSVQEELDCLAMNALAFNVFNKKNPALFAKNNAPIINDGVALYTKLFLNGDRKALVDRIKLKYGDLSLESPNHSASAFAKEIKLL